MKKDKNAENGGKPVADPGWSRNRVCQKSGDHRKRKEPGDLLQILFSEGEIRCGNSSLPDAFREIAAKISGFFGTILRDAAQEMEDTGGKNLEEIMEFVYKEIFYQGNPGGSQRKEEMEILRTLGRRLGYLDREMQIKQIELLETDVEEQEDSSEKKCRSRRKSASP